MRIALFTGNYNHIRDGVSLTLNRLVKFLGESGADVLVIAPTISKPELRHEGRMIPVPSVSIPGRPEYRLSLAFPGSVRRELERFDPDIVHIATPDLLGYKALRWAIKNGKVIVSSYHTHFPSYLKYYRLRWLEKAGVRYLKWFYSRCSQVYFPTPAMRDVLRGYGFDGDFRIWSRGVDLTLFSPEKRSCSWRREKGFGPDDVVVTFVSRLVWEKNMGMYVRTVNTLMEKYPQVKPLVVGDGPAMEKLRQMLPEAVFTGFLTDEKLARAYACSDIFLFPSDTEAFGNVTLEAMASGLPCVVADAAGSKSLVDHGRNGYLVEVDDGEGFEAAVEELVTDEKLRAGMGEAARGLSAGYSWTAINSRLLSDYEEALKRH